MVKGDRPEWQRTSEFVLSLIGYVVGLGNLYRFPYLCFKNGGGAFLIPYVISACLMSLPLCIFEIGVAQITKKGRFGCFENTPMMKGIGLASTVVNIYGNIGYILVMAWSYLFLRHSFTSGALPWSTCDNKWNTPSCVTEEMARELRKNWTASNSTSKLIDFQESSAQNQFWRNYVVRFPNPTNPLDDEFNWPMLLCLFLAYVTAFAVICRGIKSSGKVVYVTALFPYIMLFVLLIRGVTLEGAGEGIRRLFIPDFTTLALPTVWIEAACQALYTFGLGFCAIAALGSYNKSDYDFFRQCYIIVPCGMATSLLMGTVTFSILGHLAHIQQVELKDVVQSGPGLVFQVIPICVAKMPLPQLWSILFFLMMVFVTIDSIFAEFEGLVTVFGDSFHQLVATDRSRMLTNLLMGCCFFCLSCLQLPSWGIYVFELINNFGCAGIILLMIACVESLTVGWLYDARRWYDDVAAMTGRKLWPWIQYCYKYFIPTITLAIFVFFCVKWQPLKVGNFQYPAWAIGVGWCMTMSSILCVPSYAIYFLLTEDGTLMQRLGKGCSKPRCEEKIFHHSRQQECTESFI